MGLDLRIGDVLRLRKPHPCGEFLWTVTRVGADIGLTCRKCGRHVMISRAQLARRVRHVVPAEEV